jgi:signal transduction histidine kinase
MSLKLRLGLIFTGMMLLAVMATTALSWQELVEEPEDPETSQENQNETMGWRLTEIVIRGAAPATLLAFGAWWLTWRMLRPMEELSKAIELVGKGRYGEQIPQSGHTTEFARLIEAFNSMSCQVRNSFEQIREFTLHAGHELKTPLTVLRATLEQRISRTTPGSVERDELASQLEEVHRLTSIVDALSLLTKADSGHYHFERLELDLENLAWGAREDAEALAHGRGITVSTGRIDRVRVMGDRFRLRQLLLILADNAVKYNHPGGSILLELEARDGEAIIRMVNSGKGLADGEHLRVFDRFYRGVEAQAMGIEGSGLGLSIAKWIAESHGGRLSVRPGPSLIIVECVLPRLTDKSPVSLERS